VLFNLAMDPLQKILHLAIERGFLHQISPRSKDIKASLYADDVAIFVRPNKQDIAALKETLDMFGQATGLVKNLQKTKIFPISCQGMHLEEILEGFLTPIKSVPCHYLGLSLHLKKLRRIDFMPLLNKVGGKLPGWKGKLMSKGTRGQLVNSVLTAIVIYHATVFLHPKWLIKKIDKLRRNFFWKGEEGEGNKGASALSNGT
jgi:hypothetical protein